MHDISDTSVITGDESSTGAEPHAALRALSISTLVELCQREILAYCRGEISDETYGLELLHRAIIQGDQDAWAGVVQCFTEYVRGWLRGHPLRSAACRLESEETYIALAFERFWQATSRKQVVFKTLAGALAYLRASLHGAMQDTLRAYSRPREIPLPELNELGEQSAWDTSDCGELWELLQSELPGKRERRLAYLLYYCGLKPREIIHFCPQEWSDVQEIYRLRRNILERLLRKADQLRWRLDHGSVNP